MARWAQYSLCLCVCVSVSVCVCVCLCVCAWSVCLRGWEGACVRGCVGGCEGAEVLEYVGWVCACACGCGCGCVCVCVCVLLLKLLRLDKPFKQWSFKERIIEQRPNDRKVYIGGGVLKIGERQNGWCPFGFPVKPSKKGQVTHKKNNPIYRLSLGVPHFAQNPTPAKIGNRNLWTLLATSVLLNSLAQE